MKRGFTIVELLIVIVVIAVLAAISIVAYNGIQSRAQLSSAQSTTSTVAKKVELFKVDNGVYPNSIDSCPTPTGTNICIGSLSSNDFFYRSTNSYGRPFYEFTSLGSSQFLYTSSGERFNNTSEYIGYTNHGADY